MATMRTQVAIVGAGPAGLVLSHLLHRYGIASVVLECRSREYVQNRVRAGVLEQGTVDLLVETGLGARLQAEGHAHQGIELRFGGRRRRIALTDLTGRSIWIYGQQKVVEDLIEGRGPDHGGLWFEVDDVGVHDVDSATPSVRFRHGEEEHVVQADFVAGCDGFHGVCRPALPEGVLTSYEREYPFAWLGILAEVAPSHDELVYTHHDRGFALLSQRGPTVSRMYLQVDPDEDIANWSDDRIWEELHRRVDTPDGWTLQEGPIFDKGIAPMRSFVAEPMQHGRLFLAGDASHIVPPTGAKGLNLAVADVKVLADALSAWYERGDADALDGYSATCLRRVWRAQHFSWWMTSMLHRFGDDPYETRLQHAQLDYVTSSTAAATSLAENYVGLPLP